jgi:hypothetical protein
MRNVFNVFLMTIAAALCAGQPAAAQPASSGPVTVEALTTVYDAESLARRDVTYRDSRLLTMRETNTEYGLPPYASRADWEARAEYIRKRILISSGLWPMPEKTPLNPEIFGRIEREDYTIEKVYIETHPDFYLAGNLYRPKGKEGPFPAVLSPHGHWSRGRLHHAEAASVPARGINLARQGYVVFAYDMVGYGDTRQVGHAFGADSLSHLWGINLLGLQLWNSIRALDFLVSLPDVDAERIAATGASGGATPPGAEVSLRHSALDVPQPDGAVVAGGREEGAVGVEGEGVDPCVGVGGECA